MITYDFLLLAVLQSLCFFGRRNDLVLESMDGKNNGECKNNLGVVMI